MANPAMKHLGKLPMAAAVLTMLACNDSLEERRTTEQPPYNPCCNIEEIEEIEVPIELKLSEGDHSFSNSTNFYTNRSIDIELHSSALATPLIANLGVDSDGVARSNFRLPPGAQRIFIKARTAAARSFKSPTGAYEISPGVLLNFQLYPTDSREYHVAVTQEFCEIEDLIFESTSCFGEELNVTALLGEGSPACFSELNLVYTDSFGARHSSTLDQEGVARFEGLPVGWGQIDLLVGQSDPTPHIIFSSSHWMLDCNSEGTDAGTDAGAEAGTGAGAEAGAEAGTGAGTEVDTVPSVEGIMVTSGANENTRNVTFMGSYSMTMKVEGNAELERIQADPSLNINCLNPDAQESNCIPSLEVFASVNLYETYTWVIELINVVNGDVLILTNSVGEVTRINL
jgi:hypothetical protein